MKAIIFLLFISLTQSSFAFQSIDKSSIKASTTYQYQIVKVQVACVYAPNEEGEGPVYHFYKSNKAYQLSNKHFTLFPSDEYDCNDEIGGSPLLTLATVNSFADKAEKIQDIEKAGGFKEVEVIFWKEVKSENIKDKLLKLFK